MPLVGNLLHPASTCTNCLGLDDHRNQDAGNQARSSETSRPLDLPCTLQGPVIKMQSVLAELIHYFSQQRSNDDCALPAFEGRVDWPKICGLQPRKRRPTKTREGDEDEEDEEDEEPQSVACWKWTLPNLCQPRPNRYESEAPNKPVKLIAVLQEESARKPAGTSIYRRINLTDSVSCVPVTKVEHFQSSGESKSQAFISNGMKKINNIKEAVYRIRETYNNERRPRSRERKLDPCKIDRSTIMYQDLDMLDGLHGGIVHDLQDCPSARLAKESRQRLRNLHVTHRGRMGQTRMTEMLIFPTMLQQILKDMYIDPELLAELDEEQKQVLFCKLREEQVRRWKERETKLEGEEKKKPKKPKPPGKNGKKHVDWLLGPDKAVWVWVMGEHANDKSIEQILEEETQKRAEKIAEQEADELAWRQEQEMVRKLREDQARLERERLLREAELRKKAEQDRLDEEKKKQELQQKEKLQILRNKHELRRRRSIEEINQLKVKRSSEIYMSFKESREKICKVAEEDSKELEIEWQEQEKKSKKAEEEIRAIARRAREEHRRSLSDKLKTDAQVIGKVAGLLDHKDGSRPPVPVKPPTLKLGRPPKPPSRQAIIDWFKDQEGPKGVGRNPGTGAIEPWFHGIITRQEAEELLRHTPHGTFLVRVSERIWGYAISYRGPERCKHFLIDTSDGNYQFFGTNQITHSKLADLVHFHKSKPISNAGQELLLHPCRQTHDPPDFADLFVLRGRTESKSSYL